MTEITRLQEKQKEDYDSLEKLLIDNRAILNPLLFEELHDLKHCIHHFQHTFKRISRSMDSDNTSIFTSQLEHTYGKMDNHYVGLIAIVQTALGVVE